MGAPAMTVEDLERFLSSEFPQAFHPHSGLTIEKVWLGGARVRQAYSEKFIRPGGTISGPTMMMLADFALYFAVLAAIGPVGLAVTTSLNINFLRRPAQRDLGLIGTEVGGDDGIVLIAKLTLAFTRANVEQDHLSRCAAASTADHQDVTRAAELQYFGLAFRKRQYAKCLHGGRVVQSDLPMSRHSHQ